MFYRWAKRLESMQTPATAFPVAGGHPAVNTEEVFELDGALVAAAIAALWVLVQAMLSARVVGLDWALVTYVPIALVALFSVVLLKPLAPGSIAVAIVFAVGLAGVMGWAVAGNHPTSANPAIEVVALAASFVLLGLVTAVFCLVVWAVSVRWLATYRAVVDDHATTVRVMCVSIVLVAGLVGAYRAFALPLSGL